jgi:hypothetical protein
MDPIWQSYVLRTIVHDTRNAEFDYLPIRLQREIKDAQGTDASVSVRWLSAAFVIHRWLRPVVNLAGRLRRMRQTSGTLYTAPVRSR